MIENQKVKKKTLKKTLFKQYVFSLFLKLSTEELDLMQKGSELKNSKSEARRRMLQMI